MHPYIIALATLIEIINFVDVEPFPIRNMNDIIYANNYDVIYNNNYEHEHHHNRHLNMNNINRRETVLNENVRKTMALASIACYIFSVRTRDFTIKMMWIAIGAILSYGALLL